MLVGLFSDSITTPSTKRTYDKLVWNGYSRAMAAQLLELLTTDVLSVQSSALQRAARQDLNKAVVGCCL